MTSPLDEGVIEGQVSPEPDLQDDKLLCQHRHATFMRMTKEAVRGQPFADVLSLSDGPPGAGSGVPYFYLSPLQQSVGNLQVSMRAPRRGPACPLSPARAQGRQRAHAGPCAPAPAGRALLRPGRGSADHHPGVSHAPRNGATLGRLLCHLPRGVLGHYVSVNETERDIAKRSLFIRHPEMETWPSGHNWFFAKLNITNIWLLDYFGGPKIVTPEEYYNVTFQ
ncbi:protein CREG1 [Pteropus alecto]|uniref:protein CREG1 n=1 Tax=Pteropus alecto TaxID=9402 RepID=UPI000D5343C8|nr:protein CREG1 [Pteropus alecto]